MPAPEPRVIEDEDFTIAADDEYIEYGDQTGPHIATLPPFAEVGIGKEYYIHSATANTSGGGDPLQLQVDAGDAATIGINQHAPGTIVTMTGSHFRATITRGDTKWLVQVMTAGVGAA